LRAATTGLAPAAASDGDRRLVADVLAGRAGAFEQLVREYQGLCWHVVQRMVRHPEDTRELCQEAFLRVHRSLHRYRFDAPLKSWIAQVAWSIARRHLERKRIPLVDAVDDEGACLLDNIGDGHDLEDAAADAQVQSKLHAAIERLPPLQRTILSLYHLDEVPIGEIAGITGLAEGTIKSHLFRSRKRLRELLDASIGAAA
jgi:RNA polymerase sigma-70 factor (ECF subfamily)